MKKSIFTLFFLVFFSLYIFGQENHISLAKVQKGEKYGYVDGEANLIIPVQYDKLGEFNEGLVTGQKNEEWFILDTKGNIVLELGTRYKYIGQFGSGLCFATNSASYNDEKTLFIGDDDIRFINIKGKEVFILHDSIPRYIQNFKGFRFHNGFLQIESPSTETDYMVYGYVNTKGKLVIPQKFHVDYMASYGNYGRFYDGLALTPSQPYSEYLNGGNLQEYGFIDTTGKWVIAPNFSHGLDFENGTTSVDSMIYVLSSPSMAIIMGDTTISYVSQLIDKNGENVFPYDVSMNGLTSNYIITCKTIKDTTRYALAKKDGTYITDYTTDMFILPINGGHIIVRKGEESGIFTKDGKWLQPIKNSNYEVFEYFIGRVSKNDDPDIICFIDMDGNTILPFKKRDETKLEGGMIRETIGFKNGAEYENFDFDTGKSNGIFAYYSRKGKLLDLSEYDEVETFKWVLIK